MVMSMWSKCYVQENNVNEQILNIHGETALDIAKSNQLKIISLLLPTIPPEKVQALKSIENLLYFDKNFSPHLLGKFNFIGFHNNYC